MEVKKNDWLHSYDNGDYEWKKDGKTYRSNADGSIIWIDGEQYEVTK